MPTYRFEYIKNGNKPSKTIEAADEADATRLITLEVSLRGATLVEGSIRLHEPSSHVPAGTPERFADEAMQSN